MMEVKIKLLIDQLYQCISGGCNHDRNWSLYKSLFLPEARLMIAQRNGGDVQLTFHSVDEYIDYFIQNIGDKSFYETDVRHRIQFQDSFAVVWSDYEARTALGGNVIYAGTNCFQIFFGGRDWRVVSILWERKVNVK